MYQHYLILFAEITRNKKAKFWHDEEEFIVESPKDGVWLLSINLMTFQGKIPSKVAECLFSCNLQSFQTLGPQLKIEDNKILLKTAVKTPSGFIEFKNLFERLAFEAKEWRETLRELSRQSPSKCFNQNLLFAY
jgi:hypothetical protein